MQSHLHGLSTLRQTTSERRTRARSTTVLHLASLSCSGQLLWLKCVNMLGLALEDTTSPRLLEMHMSCHIGQWQSCAAACNAC